MKKGEARITPRFSVCATAYVKVAARRRLWCIIPLPALALLACAVAGFADMRWWYVGLMLLFIVFPMVLSFTWIVMAAHPAMRWLLRPQCWTFSPGAVEVDFFHFPPAGPDTSDRSDRTDNTDSPDGLNSDIPVEHLHIELRDITEAETVGQYRVLDLSGRPLKIDFLLIPNELVPPDFNID